METTIQLEMRTVLMLKMLKEEMGAKSYNEVVLQLVPKKVPESMFGSNPKLSRFRETDRFDAHGF